MNLMDLFIRISADDKASKEVDSLSKKLKTGLSTAAKVGAAAVTAAITGVAILAKNALDNYAEYEQLVGGAELMFGSAFETVMKNAQNAYKTVQMSQNEYLQQVNGFATGLKTALGGNEQAAADLAHRIVKAEADIVAATGETAENVQNAFNGIMKSNFTMLDNLKIGITPTKEGFQEVIDKVNEWNAANGEATNYQMDNLADMQSALVDYIEMVGMSGYAQTEASKTISGSVASMKASWSDLLTSIADENSNFEEKLDNFIGTIVGDESGGGVLNNIMPRLEQILVGITGLIEKGVPIIVERLPSLIETILPPLLSAAMALIDAVVDNLPSILQTLLSSIIPLLPGILNDIVMAVVNLIPSLAGIIITGLIDLVANGIVPAIPMITLSLVQALPGLIGTLTTQALTILTDMTESGLLDMIIYLIAASPGILMNLIASVPMIFMDVITAIVDFFTGKSDEEWLNIGMHMINSIKQGFLDGWNGFAEWLSEITGGALDWTIDTGENDAVRAELEESTYQTQQAGGAVRAYGGYGPHNAERQAPAVNVTQNIYSQKQTAADLMQEAQWNAERAVYMGV